MAPRHFPHPLETPVQRFTRMVGRRAVPRGVQYVDSAGDGVCGTVGECLDRSTEGPQRIIGQDHGFPDREPAEAYDQCEDEPTDPPE
jgi:hypothetical protein